MFVRAQLTRNTFKLNDLPGASETHAVEQNFTAKQDYLRRTKPRRR